MEHFFIRTAGVTAEITAPGSLARRLCEAYEIPAPERGADIVLAVSDDDIRAMAEKCGTDAARRGYLAYLCIHEKLSVRMAAFGRFLMHGAVIACRGRGYMFTAPSGTGKSTHIRLWQEHLGASVEVVNGDKPFLSVEPAGGVRVWGTPWAGKERWQKNTGVPLCGLCLLERGTENTIERIAPESALAPLFAQTFHAENGETEWQTLGFLDALLRAVPVYRLACDMSEDAVRCSYEALTGERYAPQ